MKILTALLALSTAAFFFSCSPKPKKPPQWANFFSAEEYNAFLGEVENYFKSRNIKIKVGDGFIEAEGWGTMGLTNIAQICRQYERETWPATIEDYFNNLKEGMEFEKAFAEKVKNYDDVDGYLAVRLFPADYLDSLGKENFYYRQDLEGTVTAVVFDLPTSVRPVSRDESASWNKSEDELFKRGFENVQKIPPERDTVDLGDGINVVLLSGDSFFISTYAFFLDKCDGCLGKYGALIGVPTRHMLIAYPINDSKVVIAPQKLIPILQNRFNEGPGSIAPNLYWYRDGKFVDIPYKLTDKELSIMPPDEFTEILGKLE